MGISPLQLLIILLIVVLIFGTKRLRSIGFDLGSAVKNFKKAVKPEPSAPQNEEQPIKLIEATTEKASTSAHSEKPAHKH